MTTTNDGRPGFLDILSQDERWWPAAGPSLRLEEMGPRHRRLTLAFLRRNESRYALIIAGAVISASDNVQWDVLGDLGREDPDGTSPWLEDMPLVTRLRDLVEADRTAGAEDEALPCADWCLVCDGMKTGHGVEYPCNECPDCSPAVAALEEATWD